MTNELITQIKSTVENGDILTSIFVNNDDWYSTEYIKQMWLYFIMNNETFNSLFPLKDDVKNNFKSGIKEEMYTEKNINYYKKIWEPLLELSVNNISNSLNCFLMIMCSSNSIKDQNSAIIYDHGKFSVIELNNSIENVKMINELLIKKEKFGKYCHILVIKKK